MTGPAVVWPWQRPQVVRWRSPDRAVLRTEVSLRIHSGFPCAVAAWTRLEASSTLALREVSGKVDEASCLVIPENGGLENPPPVAGPRAGTVFEVA